MSELDEKLLNNENIVFRTKKHWATPIAASGVAVLMVLGALLAAWLQTDQDTGIMGFVNRVLSLIQLGLFLGGIGWIIYNIVAWRTAEYAVSNLRVLGHEGLLRARSTDTLLTSLSDVRSRITALGKALGYGDLVIMSASGEAGQDTLRTIEKVDEFKKVIIEQKTSDAAKAAGGAPTAAQQAGAAPNVTDTIAQLAKLRDSGAISAEEYEAKKNDLLSRL